MADLELLLNPMQQSIDSNTVSIMPANSPALSESTSPRKKVKLTKDAPVFHPGPIRGTCRFPPDEYQDKELEVQHARFKVSPFGEIADYPRHIPYNSEKKSFLKSTHREHLAVFQYTFKVPKDDTTYTMLWDYNIGLVRTTPLFKCTGHSKTTPAKVLARNPGLKEICHSITGGALVAQGYWIPLAAARAIAATFCYDIRFALTPVFGHDFPNLCIKPGDDGFGDMVIDPEITKSCAEQARQFRDEELDSATHTSTVSCYTVPISTPSPPRKRATAVKKLKQNHNVYMSPYDSPYVSDTSTDDGYESAGTLTAKPGQSYHATYQNTFTPINTPRSVPRSVPYPERRLPSPHEILAQAGHQYDVRPATPATPPETVRWSSPEISPKTIPARLTTPKSAHCDCDEKSGCEERDFDWLRNRIRPEEEHAAYVLLGLKLGKTTGEVAQGLGFTIAELTREGDDNERRPVSA